jgi:hypothetical protein
VGDALTFKILKNDLVTVLHRSVVRSAADANHQNINQERLKMMYQTELGLSKNTQTSILAVELGLRYTT